MILDGMNDQRIDAFYDAIFERYGYDFRNYSLRNKRNRLLACLADSGIHTLDEFQTLTCSETHFFFSVLSKLTITVTNLFRNPTFFRALREKVLPELSVQTALKIWHPGCSTGEEVFSMAILLAEEGLLESCVIYGTDINPGALRKAKSAMISCEQIRASAQNYYEAGGRESLTRYFHVHHGFGLFTKIKSGNMVFSVHNLATDKSFNEMQLIVCRNVLIYFNENLQNQALELMTDSLASGGYLCLGKHETLMFTAVERAYDLIDGFNKIYRKR